MTGSARASERHRRPGRHRSRSRQGRARAAGRTVHKLEPEDLVALTIDAAAVARLPLPVTRWIPALVASP